MSPVWAPTSDRLVFVARRGDTTEIRTLNIHTGGEEVLMTNAVLGEDYDFSPSFRGNSLGFSPDGRSLAFLASRVPEPESQEEIFHAIEADEDFDPNAPEPDPAFRLFVMEVGGHQAHPLTDETLNVATFDWSPDGRRIAFEASTDPALSGNYMKGDIFVVDVAGGTPLRLVQLDGWDRMPIWSPDGTQIAFGSQRGTADWMYTASLAVVAADGSLPPRFIGDELDRLGGGAYYHIQWDPDGSTVEVSMVHKLSTHLFRVKVADGATERITPRDDRSYEGFKYSADGSKVVFTAESAVLPAEVFISGTESFEPRRLTEVNPQWDAVRLPTVEMVKWRSSDDRWDIHGLLLKPPDHDSTRSYPTLTAILGGPSMVRQQHNLIWNYPILSLADMGYVVFLPNSRGRGGFGMDFVHAIRDEQSYMENPLTDVLTGVEALVRAGVAHPDSLGVLGFSYGGTLTSNAVTKTDQFKAAIYGEGSPYMMDVMIRYPTKFFLGLFRDMWGLRNPYEPDVIDRAFKQSALFRLDRVRTPVLVEAGEVSFRPSDRALYRGLQHFGVPSEFLVYPRSGHGWDEPLLMKDAYRRHIAWFDYWIKDRPYPDREKQAEYDAWKRRMESER
jgi:dipeptidyl aminopeptidase/acylaminoacyl peptidase